MKRFEYERASDPASAASRVAQGGTFIAGGTNLVDLMKHGIETPRRLVDISRLPRTIEPTDDGGLRIGASVTNTELAVDERVRQGWPLLSAALLSGATVQLRNKATTGGNLLQRTRCYYFYDTARACNKRQPGSGCDALEGYNRIHAILGGSEHCIATHPSDMSVAMAALGARLETLRPDGRRRRLPVEDLHRLPGDTPHLEHVLEPGELIESVWLPPSPPPRQVYRKTRDRASYAFALVSVGVALSLEHGRVTAVRIALGGVAPKPWRARAAEDSLEGRRGTIDDFRDAARAELRSAKGRGHNDFKIVLAQRLIASALAEAAGFEDHRDPTADEREP